MKTDLVSCVRQRARSLGRNGNGLTTVFSVLLISGCGSAARPPIVAAQHSAFFENCHYLQGLVKRVAAAHSIQWSTRSGESGVYTGVGRRERIALVGRLNSEETFQGEFASQREEAAKFMVALRDELEKQAKEAGARLHNRGATIRDGVLQEFRFAFDAGEALGGVFGKLESNEGADGPRHKLYLSLGEDVP
jgi:hypothetical protein